MEQMQIASLKQAVQRFNINNSDQLTRYESSYSESKVAHAEDTVTTRELKALCDIANGLESKVRRRHRLR